MPSGPVAGMDTVTSCQSPGARVKGVDFASAWAVAAGSHSILPGPPPAERARNFTAAGPLTPAPTPRKGAVPWPVTVTTPSFTVAMQLRAFQPCRVSALSAFASGFVSEGAGAFAANFFVPFALPSGLPSSSG